MSSSLFEVLVKEEYITESLAEVEQSTSDFVSRLASLDKNRVISQNLYDVFYRLNGLDFGDYKQIAELIYANAFLALLLSTAFYQSVQPHVKVRNRRIESIDNLAIRDGKKEGLKQAFKLIQEIDYKPIYAIASEVVELLPPNLFDDVVRLGKKLGSDQMLLKRDFSGRIYHKIVGDWSIRKGFATYFTTIPASYLLAYLTLFSNNEDQPASEKTKVCDFMWERHGTHCGLLSTRR